MKPENNDAETKRTKRTKRTYPYLGKSPRTRMVVLFTGASTGTVVFDSPRSKLAGWFTGAPGHPLGYTADDWEEQNFEMLEGTVALSND